MRKLRGTTTKVRYKRREVIAFAILCGCSYAEIRTKYPGLSAYVLREACKDARIVIAIRQISRKERAE